MAYRLNPDESVPSALKRIVREEMAAAAGALGQDAARSREEAIHEARKSVKKVRAVLRLVRPELGQSGRKENARLRDAGHKLSEVRDSTAVIEVFDDLAKKYSAELPADKFAAIRRRLLERREEVEKRNDLEQVLPDVASELHKAGAHAKEWLLRGGGFSGIAPGLERTFRAGRKAFDAVLDDPRPEVFHEWRKRVKDHWYHVRLLESVWTGVSEGYANDLKELETWLGEDHNLCVLHETLTADPAYYGSHQEAPAIDALANRYQAELRDKALHRGRRIYGEKPGHFIERLKRLWKNWKAKPAAAKKAALKSHRRIHVA